MMHHEQYLRLRMPYTALLLLLLEKLAVASPRARAALLLWTRSILGARARHRRRRPGARSRSGASRASDDNRTTPPQPARVFNTLASSSPCQLSPDLHRACHCGLSLLWWVCGYRKGRRLLLACSVALIASLSCHTAAPSNYKQT